MHIRVVSRGGNREKMPEEQTSSWVVISVHAKGNPWRDLSHVSATKKNRKTVLEWVWPGRLRWLQNDKETKVEGYRQKYTKPCGRQGEARVRFEDLDVLFDRHVRRRRLFVKCFANPFHEERWLFREREKKTKRSRYPYGSLHARSCCLRNWRCEAYINTNERAIVSMGRKRLRVFENARRR